MNSKLTAEQLEARDNPSSTVWYWAGQWHIVHNGPVTATVLPLGDPSLPQQAIDHPDAFVGKASEPFVRYSDADNPQVLLVHADQAASVVITLGDPDTVVTTGADYQPGTTSAGGTDITATSGTITSATGPTPGAKQSHKVRGHKNHGGGHYTSGGAIHVGYGHDGKHGKHGKHK